ncbi:MAG: LysM peptidoglycan-binding domain-containing protein [Anaerolineales bacterium]|nr:LysM peptidoglycan-binding domain-containing protein [Anaerolineales bacterium]
MNSPIRPFYRWLIAVLLFTSILPAAAQADPSQSCAEIYTVQADDWLSKIANKTLGDLLAYPAIVSATNQQHATDASFAEIINPDLIETGWKLCIPVGAEAGELLTEATPPAVPPPTLNSLAVYSLDDFSNDFKFSAYVKPDWIYTSPERLTKFDITAEHAARAEQYGYRANYWWNEYLSDDYFINRGIFNAVPPQVYTYHPAWGTAIPAIATRPMSLCRPA